MHAACRGRGGLMSRSVRSSWSSAFTSSLAPPLFSPFSAIHPFPFSLVLWSLSPPFSSSLFSICHHFVACRSSLRNSRSPKSTTFLFFFLFGAEQTEVTAKKTARAHIGAPVCRYAEGDTRVWIFLQWQGHLQNGYAVQRREVVFHFQGMRHHST